MIGADLLSALATDAAAAAPACGRDAGENIRPRLAVPASAAFTVVRSLMDTLDTLVGAGLGVAVTGRRR